MPYIAKVVAESGWLLGNVKEHTSCKLDSYEEASDWARIVLDVNLKHGRDAEIGGVYEV